MLRWLESGGLATAIVARDSVESITEHLRGWAQARGPGGVEQDLDWSRPSVMRSLVQASTEEERRALAGPIDELWCQSAEGPMLLQYRLAESPPRVRAIDLVDGFDLERELGSPVDDPLADDAMIFDEPASDGGEPAAKVESSRGMFQLRPAHLRALEHSGRAQIIGAEGARMELSSRQLRAVRQVIRSNVVDDIGRTLRRLHPEFGYGLTEAQLQERLRFGTGRARGHGFVSAREAGAFVQLMFLVGPNFDELPAIAARLAPRNGSSTDRLAAVFELTTAEQWQQARRLADPDAWS